MRMESSIKRTKRKKSGAENRKASKARREENERLGTFMKSYFTKSSKSYEDDAKYFVIKIVTLTSNTLEQFRRLMFDMLD